MSSRKKPSSAAYRKNALVLSAGGARGAYQIGVVKAISEMKGLANQPSPFGVVCGVSAGSLNAAGLAAHADNFSIAAEHMTQVWAQLQPEQVFRTDIRSLGKTSLQWMRDLSFGGLMGGGEAKSLLDTAPLRELIQEKIPLHRIKNHITQGFLHAVGVTATNYYTSNAVTFVQAAPGTPMWKRQRRLGELTKLHAEHLMASSAIPLFFPSVEWKGRHFGDGCVRNVAPISPAVHLGAEKILAIGVRRASEINEGTHGPRNTPSVAHISGVLLDAVLLDSIELDIVRLNKINSVLASLHMEEVSSGGQRYRPLQAVWINPSESLGEIAADYAKRLPRVLRYLLKGLGPDAHTTDILSFLLFDSTFCNRLIEIGYKDGKDKYDEIQSLLEAP